GGADGYQRVSAQPGQPLPDLPLQADGRAQECTEGEAHGERLPVHHTPPRAIRSAVTATLRSGARTSASRPAPGHRSRAPGRRAAESTTTGAAPARPRDPRT